MDANILPAKSREEFREWLAANAASSSECWVSVKRGKPVYDDVFYYHILSVCCEKIRTVTNDNSVFGALMRYALER